MDRLQKRYKAAQEDLDKAARSGTINPPSRRAEGELNALLLFQADMGTFQRRLTFLSQIFDYGNTAIEKRSIFSTSRCSACSRSAREREGIDLSRVVLTHHNLRNQGKRSRCRWPMARIPSWSRSRTSAAERPGEAEGPVKRDHPARRTTCSKAS